MTREGLRIKSERPWTAISATTSWNTALLNLTSQAHLLRKFNPDPQRLFLFLKYTHDIVTRNKRFHSTVSTGGVIIANQISRLTEQSSLSAVELINILVPTGWQPIISWRFEALFVKSSTEIIIVSQFLNEIINVYWFVIINICK